MNNCILMAEIVQAPQLRYTPGDNQIPVAEMLVQFPGLRSEDPPATLKVVGWGNLAQEIQQRCHLGEQVVLEGRLNMNTIERPEGFKEKRAELVAQKVHYLGVTGISGSSLSSSAPSTEYQAPSPEPSTPHSPVSAPATAQPVAASRTVSNVRSAPVESAPPAVKTAPSTVSPPPSEVDVDDIPF